MKEISVKRDSFDRGTYNVYGVRQGKLISEQLGKVQKNPSGKTWNYSMLSLESQHEAWILGFEFELGQMFFAPRGSFKTRKEAADALVMEFESRYVHQRPLPFQYFLREWELARLPKGTMVKLEYREGLQNHALFSDRLSSPLIAVGYPYHLKMLAKKYQWMIAPPVQKLEDEEKPVDKPKNSQADQEQIDDLLNLLVERPRA